MIETFLSGGVLMWPLLLIGLGVLVLAARVLRILRDPARPNQDAEAPLLAILFWGGMGAVLGLIATVVGVMQMARVIAAMGPVRDTLVWGGIGASLVTLVFGMAILLVALLLWFVLRLSVLRRASPPHPHPSAA